MLDRILKNLKGYLKIQIKGYSPERFLNLCKNKGIVIWDLEVKGNNYEMFISVSGFRKLKPLLRKTQTKVIIIERYGIPFFLHKYRKRKMFFSGCVLFCIIIFILSKFIWNIEVIGNQSITDETIMQYLKTEQIYHGMPIKRISCDKLATEIRKDFNEIIWVSVSLDGTNLIINVKENTDTFRVSQVEEEPSDIVADQDGIISEIIVRSGVPLVTKGTEVKCGDILVSGTVAVIDDAGEVIREDYKKSDADICAEVILNYQDFCENTHQIKSYMSDQKRTFIANVFGVEICFGNKSYKAKQWEIKSYMNQMKINDHFLLPVFIGEKRAYKYRYTEKVRSTLEKESILQHNLKQYREELEEQGVQILEENVVFRNKDNGLEAKGTIKVITTIGTERKRIDF